MYLKSVSAIAVVFALSGCTKSPEDVAASTKDAASVKEVAAVPAQPILPATPPEPKAALIPAGTRFKIRTASAISTKTAKAGEGFSATLAAPVTVEGKVLIPSGADVSGIVANSDDGGRVKGVATLSLRVTGIEIDGTPVPVKSSVYVKDAPATKKKDALKIGVGAGIGAAIGAIAGGGKGAAIGAASGGAAGTGVVLATRGEPAVVDAESLITFKLASPMEVPLPR